MGFEVGKIYVRVKGANAKFKALSVGKTTLTVELWQPRAKQWKTSILTNLRSLERALENEHFQIVEED